MESAYTRNRIWTTNNGYITEPRHLHTPRNLDVPATISGEIIENSRQANETGRDGTRLASSDGGVIVADGYNEGGVALRKHTIFNTTFVGVQSKFRRKYYHKVVFGALILLIIILLITIIVLSIKYKQSSAICRSKDCIRTAASLIYSMDEQTDPCEDFYQFTCGNWANEHPRPDSVTSNDWFREQQARIMLTLRKFLSANITDSDPGAVGKAKIMYKSCMNTELLDKREMEPLIFYLRKLKLPLVPSGLNITLSAESLKKYDIVNSSSGEQFDWLQSIILLKKYFGMDAIFGFDVFPDPMNRTINRIALGTPETDSALPFNNDDIHKLLRKIKRKTVYNQDNDDDIEAEEEKTLKQTTGLSAYVVYVKKIIEVYLSYLDPDLDSNEIETNIGEMALKAVKVAKAIYRIKDEAENITKPAKVTTDELIYTTVPELQKQTDKLIAPKSMPIWQKYFDIIFADTNHTKEFLSSLKIITSEPDIYYLQNIVEYLSETPMAHIEFYIWLNTIEELVLHTTAEMRLLHTEYMRLIIGTEGSTPRSLYCAHGVNSLMGMAVSYALVDDAFTKETLPKVQRMLSDIRKSFDSLVQTVSWMDAATKRATLEKSASMKSFIGFPEWISNATTLDAYYAAVRVNESLHLENMIGVLHWQMQTKLDNLHEPEPFGWATSPSNVNAFHTFQANTITVPIAILQFPFYELGLEVCTRINHCRTSLNCTRPENMKTLQKVDFPSRALNYGSIGTILGHELTHGFDDSGRMFDKNGNMRQWWSNETISEYVNRTACFVDQYNHYYLTDIGEYIDGDLTLGENIADNGGMREAFFAYQRYVKEIGQERMTLPGLEHYTHEQLFFISFGNLWCETYTPAGSRYAVEDSHCPGKFRLKGVLTNSIEFSRTFNCRKGTGMNPVGEKCRIW